MKRSILFLLSAVAAGALAGYVLSDLSTADASLPKLPLSNAASTAMGDNRAGARESETVVVRLVNASSRLAGHIPSERPRPVSLLLREPVMIMHGGENRGETLPSGTPVDLVQNEGRFLRVRHEQNVVTVPRSVVVTGVARTN